MVSMFHYELSSLAISLPAYPYSWVKRGNVRLIKASLENVLRIFYINSVEMIEQKVACLKHFVRLGAIWGLSLLQRFEIFIVTKSAVQGECRHKVEWIPAFELISFSRFSPPGKKNFEPLHRREVWGLVKEIRHEG